MARASHPIFLMDAQLTGVGTSGFVNRRLAPSGSIHPSVGIRRLKSISRQHLVAMCANRTELSSNYCVSAQPTDFLADLPTTMTLRRRWKNTRHRVEHYSRSVAGSADCADAYHRIDPSLSVFFPINEYPSGMFFLYFYGCIYFCSYPTH